MTASGPFGRQEEDSEYPVQLISFSLLQYGFSPLLQMTCRAMRML
jgi:hypothetical protein